VGVFACRGTTGSWAGRGDDLRRRSRCKLRRFPACPPSTGVRACKETSAEAPGGAISRCFTGGGTGEISRLTPMRMRTRSAALRLTAAFTGRSSCRSSSAAGSPLPGRVCLVRPFAQLKTILESAENVVQLKPPFGVVREVQSDDSVVFASIMDNAADLPPGNSAILRADIDTCRTVHAPPRGAGFKYARKSRAANLYDSHLSASGNYL
jgi:hypothetical protein